LNPRDPNRRIAIRASVSSDVNGLRRHFRVARRESQSRATSVAASRGAAVDFAGKCVLGLDDPATNPGLPYTTSTEIH